METGKSNVGHSHQVSDVTNLQTTLDSKASNADVATKLPKATGTNSVYGKDGSGNDVLIGFSSASANASTIVYRGSGGVTTVGAPTAAGHAVNKGTMDTALSSKADLVGGVVPTSQLPRVTLGETLSVASNAAMLALDAQPGDVAIRTDTNNVYMLRAAPASTQSNWLDLTATAQSGGVTSINGQTGTVVLAAADINAVPTSRSVGAGTGLTGGGDLTGNRTIGLNTASQTSLSKADSAVQGFVNGAATGTRIERMTSAQYAALATKDANTVYLVSG